MNTTELLSELEAEQEKNKQLRLENADLRDNAKAMLPDNQARVADWMRTAGQVVNDTPTMPDLETRALRARLITEEGLETICKGLGVMLKVTLPDGNFFYVHENSKIEFIEHANNEPSLTEIADGLADSMVVLLGTAAACGIPAQACFDEVMRSNDTKFIDGHRREDGKWIKGPSYSPANLASILGIETGKVRNDR